MEKSGDERTPLLTPRGSKSRDSTSSFNSDLYSKKTSFTNRGLWSFATPLDYILVGIGGLASFVHGAGFPLLAVVLGGMTTVFLRAQNSEFVVGINMTKPDGLAPISKEEFDAEVNVYCIYYVVLGLAMFVTSYIQIICWESFSERLTHRLRQCYLRAILRQEIAWFDTQQTGNLTARLTDDLERVREGLGDKLSLFVQMVAAFIAGFGLGFFYSWSMTLVMMIMTPFVAFSGAWMAKIVATRTQVEQETYAVAGAIASETFSSIRTVHSLNGHKRELTRFEAALERGRKIGIVKYFYMGVGVGFGQLCLYASYAIAFWYGGQIIMNDPSFDRGIIFTVFFAVMSGSTALGGALPHLNTLSAALGAARSVLKVVNTHPGIDPYSLEGVILTDLKGAITLKNVHFSYPSRSDLPILRGVSLDIRAGQSIALVGSSGCGKSTIVNLLLRFYDPLKGKVCIDGVDIRELNVHNIRDQIGIVSQEPILFDGTLYENIVMGNERATNDQVVEACTIANAAEFISKLPESYGTRVGERGVQLSGGQKQRIAIARAIVKNPKILLLDEATSALDTEAESLVQEALDKAQSGRTTIIVAHRLSTIRNVDQIFVFKEGNIVERGTHSELLEKKGIFYDMTQAQLLRQDHSNLEAEDVEESDVISYTESFRSRKSSTAIGADGSPILRKTSRLSRSVTTLASSTISLQKAADESKLEPTPISKIFMWNRDKWCLLFCGLLGASLWGSTTPIFALVYAQIFDVYSEPIDIMKGHIWFWCGMFILLGLLHAIGFFISANTLGRCGEGLTMKLRYEAFKNLLRQDIGFYDDLKHGTGKLCTRFATDAPNVRYVFTRLPVVFSSCVTIIGALLVGFIYGWQLAIVLIIMVPLLIISGYFEMKMQFGKKIRDTKLLEEAGKVAAQAVEHIRTVQALNKQEKFHFMYCDYLSEPHKENMCQVHTYGGVFAFSQSIIFFMYAVAFYLGSILVDNGQMQPTDVYRVFFAISFCGQAVGNCSSFIPDVVKARLAASLLFYLIEHPTEIDSLSNNGLQKELSGNISLRSLYFNYPTRRHTKVLKGLSLEVNPGQTVALVGHSGCGKSTVMALLERFYNPSRGCMMLDGENIRNLNIHNLRNQVCIVSQEPTLFGCTIGENICYGMDKIVTHQQMTDAAKMANIHDFILSLPAGYDTQVGEKGTQISGGQKQRIAIARALIRNPAILLLDEATSALDTESEKIVQEALEKAKEGRTCLIIAHRLSTIQNSDVIAMVEDGKITDKGTHEQLLHKNPSYKALCQKQQLVENQ